MVSCPSCGAQVNADFGMVTCTSCDSVFMVEIDGTVTLPSGEESEAISSEPSHQTDDEQILDTELGSQDLSQEESSYEAPDFNFNEEPHDTEEEAQVYTSPTEEVATEEIASEESQPPEETEYSEDFLDTMGDGEAQEPLQDDPNDPLGVTRFDGSAASQGADGLYYYDLRISGIDTATLKQQVVELLSDKRLNWSPEEIRKKIKMGQLTLENLNPVRAVLAILKIQTLDIDIDWDQRPYTEDKSQAQDKET